MPLSEYEQRVLDQMERSLTGDAEAPASASPRKRPRPGLRYLLVVVGTLAGLTLVLVGAMTGYVLVGIAGFVVMLAAVVAVFGRPQHDDGLADQPHGAKGRVKPAQSKSWMTQLEARWERRKDGRS